MTPESKFPWTDAYKKLSGLQKSLEDGYKQGLFDQVQPAETAALRYLRGMHQYSTKLLELGGFSINAATGRPTEEITIEKISEALKFADKGDFSKVVEYLNYEIEYFEEGDEPIRAIIKTLSRRKNG